MNRGVKVSRSISHGAHYTALVDLLCATIGIFVIVFALQDLEPPQALQPAPYDHLVICDAGPSLTYSSRNTDQLFGKIKITFMIAPNFSNNLNRLESIRH